MTYDEFSTDFQQEMGITLESLVEPVQQTMNVPVSKEKVRTTPVATRAAVKEKKTYNEVPYEGSNLKLTPLFRFENQKVNGNKNEPINDEAFDRAMGESSMETRTYELKDSAYSQFADRFGKEMEGKTLEKRLAEEYRRAFNGKNSIAHKTKRAETAKKRIRRQRQLLAEQDRFLEQDELNTRSFKESLTDNRIEWVDKRFASKEEKDAIRFWLMIESEKVVRGKKSVQLDFNSNLSKDDKSFMNNLQKQLKDLEKFRFDELLYEDDLEYVQLNAHSYRKLARMASADIMLQKLRNEPNYVGLNYTKLRANIEFAKRLKADYDARARMISSPYYAIVERNDISGYLGDGDIKRLETAKAKGKISEGLYEYIKLVREAERLHIGKNDYGIIMQETHVRCRRKNFAINEVQYDYNGRVLKSRVHYDISNPIFAKTQEAVDIKLLMPDPLSLPEELYLDASRAKNEFSEAFVDIFEFLHDNGYTINDKYENLSEEKQAKLLDHSKETFKKSRKNNPHGADDFPKIRVNGKEYCVYIYSRILPNIKFVSGPIIEFEVDKDKEKEVQELFSKYEELFREGTIRDAQNLDSGDKTIVGLVHERKFKKARKVLDDELERLYPSLRRIDKNAESAGSEKTKEQTREEKKEEV